MNINVGDVVTWRSGKSKTKVGLPIGIANCKVVELGHAPGGEPAAMIQLPQVLLGGSVMASKLERDGLDLSQPVGVLIADLEK